MLEPLVGNSYLFFLSHNLTNEVETDASRNKQQQDVNDVFLADLQHEGASVVLLKHLLIFAHCCLRYGNQWRMPELLDRTQLQEFVRIFVFDCTWQVDIDVVASAHICEVLGVQGEQIRKLKVGDCGRWCLIAVQIQFVVENLLD